MAEPLTKSTGDPTKRPLIERLREKYETIKLLEEEFRTTDDSRNRKNIMRALPERRDEFNRLAMQAMPVLLDALDALTKPRES